MDRVFFLIMMQPLECTVVLISNTIYSGYYILNEGYILKHGNVLRWLVLHQHVILFIVTCL